MEIDEPMIIYCEMIKGQDVGKRETGFIDLLPKEPSENFVIKRDGKYYLVLELDWEKEILKILFQTANPQRFLDTLPKNGFCQQPKWMYKYRWPTKEEKRKFERYLKGYELLNR